MLVIGKHEKWRAYISEASSKVETNSYFSVSPQTAAPCVVLQSALLSAEWISITLDLTLLLFGVALRVEEFLKP